MKAYIFFLAVFFLFQSAFAFGSRPKQIETKENKNTVTTNVLLTNKTFESAFKKVIEKNPEFNLKALEKAFKFLDENVDSLKKENLCLGKDNIRNKSKIRNLNCMVVADYTKSKKTPRLLIINPKNGDSELFYTAHGKGSHNKDEIETGHIAKKFSNKSGSNMTSLGFYLTDNLYNSSKSTFGPGPANGLKLDGLNCTNNNARKRYIVMHTADYVQPLSGDVEKIGNSEGCVTVPEMRKDVLEKCKGGALVYAYHSSIEDRSGE
jgi:hypothetical protein